MQTCAERARAVPPLPQMRFEKGRGLLIQHRNEDAAFSVLVAASGFSSAAAFDSALNHLINIAPGNGESAEIQRTANGLLAAVAGVRPQDDIEAMLAVHMAMTHELTMTMGRRLAKASNLPQQDSAERAFSKLARTFAAQVEALKRHRTGGQQKVVVEHATVNEGGQAIVGHVTAGGEGRKSGR